MALLPRIWLYSPTTRGSRCPRPSLAPLLLLFLLANYPLGTILSTQVRRRRQLSLHNHRTAAARTAKLDSAPDRSVSLLGTAEGEHRREKCRLAAQIMAAPAMAAASRWLLPKQAAFS